MMRCWGSTFKRVLFQQHILSKSNLSLRTSFHVTRHFTNISTESMNNGREQNKDENRSKLHALVTMVAVGAVCAGYAWSHKDSQCLSAEPSSSEIIKGNPSTVDKRLSLSEAILVASDWCQRIKDETGCPGLVVAVTVNGQEVWNKGLGYADIENRVQCHADTVMRIASISKTMTMTAVAKAWEQGKLDLDRSVTEYIKTWPQKTYTGKKVEINTRQLVHHMSGIRHYDKNCGRKKPNMVESSESIDKQKSSKNTSDADEKEFYQMKNYRSVTEALEIFKNDELCSEPGTEYLYTTHGWTLVSAVLEVVTGHTFPILMRKMFSDLGLENTYLDENNPIIYNRARHYVKNKEGRIINSSYVDLSNKWAGGGFLSTARDVNRFGNAMLYCLSPGSAPGYLKPNTIQMLLTPEKRAKCDWDADGYYGMGWGVVAPESPGCGHCRQVRRYYSHTGGAVGATSVLIVLPSRQTFTAKGSGSPQGVVVTMIANLGSCKGLTETALQIAKLFENVDFHQSED